MHFKLKSRRRAERAAQKNAAASSRSSRRRAQSCCSLALVLSQLSSGHNLILSLSRSVTMAAERCIIYLSSICTHTRGPREATKREMTWRTLDRPAFCVRVAGVHPLRLSSSPHLSPTSQSRMRTFRTFCHLECVVKCLFIKHKPND
jgi:hypothetical protein